MPAECNYVGGIEWDYFLGVAGEMKNELWAFSTELFSCHCVVLIRNIELMVMVDGAWRFFSNLWKLSISLLLVQLFQLHLVSFRIVFTSFRHSI